MSITYSISINLAKVVNEGQLTDVVKRVAWQLTGTDGTHSISVLEETNLGDVDPQNFTPFGDTTEAQMVAWIEAAEPRLEAIKADVAARVNKAAAEAALVNKTLPWQPTPPMPEQEGNEA